MNRHILFTFIFTALLVVCSTTDVPLKWGIAGAGRISHDFVTAVHILPESDHKVVAVAGRTKTKTEKFAEDHQIATAYDDYLKLAEDPKVEIVYIGNINMQHFSTAKLMLEHGKHVLCEKPLTINEKQTSKLVQIAREKKLFLMEAVWSRFFPAYQKMKEIIDSGEIGDVLYCSVQFGVPLQHIERLISKKLGGGSILDLGVYILQFQQFVFRGLKPIDIVVNGHKNEFGTDETTAAIITYPGGRTAVVSTSAKVTLPNEALVVGTNGTLRLPEFWCPTKLITEEKTYEWNLPTSPVPFLHINSAGLSYEAEGVRKCIRAGLLESSNMTLDESIEIARIQDLVRQKVGAIFPEDSQEV